LIIHTQDLQNAQRGPTEPPSKSSSKPPATTINDDIQTMALALTANLTLSKPQFFPLTPKLMTANHNNSEAWLKGRYNTE